MIRRYEGRGGQLPDSQVLPGQCSRLQASQPVTSDFVLQKIPWLELPITMKF
jgi:hypothetical protein